MGSPIDLTLLKNVKDWIYGNPNQDPQPVFDDVILKRLITQASVFMLGQLQRDSLLYRIVTEVRNGTGGSSMTLKEFPVLSVSQVIVGNQTIPARPGLTGSLTPVVTFGGLQPGWTLEAASPYPPGRPQAVMLTGSRFPREFSNVQFTYAAGYVVQGEQQTVPVTNGITPLQPLGAWSGNVGLSYVGGAALVPVAANPAVGQYVPPTDANQWPLLYVFNAADEGRTIALSYSYVPADLSFATCKWVGESFNYKARIGLKRKILANQETMEYQLVSMSDDVKQALKPYQNWLPI